MIRNDSRYAERQERQRRTTIIVMMAVVFCSGAAQASHNSVALSWTAPGDDGSSGTASVYDVRYSTSNITSEAAWNSATRTTGEPAPHAAGINESFTVTGLQPNTTYYFALKVADEVPNWSTMSNIGMATTDPAPDGGSPSAITTLAAGGATNSTIALGWIATGDDAAVGTAAAYDVRYATFPITAANFATATQASGEPVPQVSGTPQGFVVGNLNATTTYYFAMKVADEVPNWSAVSNVVSLATTSAADGGAPSAIADLTAASGDHVGELDIAWTAPGDDGSAGTAALYVIKASINPITEANWNNAIPMANPPTPLVAGSQQTWTITGLTPALRYYVAIKTVDDAANASAMSNVANNVSGWEFSLDVDDAEGSLPDGFGLAQNYPNPFNPSTTIGYTIGAISHVTLQVFNVAGQAVATLVDETQPSGSYEVDWNGLASGGARVASGVYFYHIEAGSFTQTLKMVLLK